MGKTASPLPQLRGPQHDPTGQDALISPVGGSELPQRRSARPQSRARCGRRRDRCRGVRRAPITVGLRRRTAVLNGRLRRRSGVRQLGRGRTVLDPHAPCVPISADRPHGLEVDDLPARASGPVPSPTSARIRLPAVHGPSSRRSKSAPTTRHRSRASRRSSGTTARAPFRPQVTGMTSPSTWSGTES
jgi:hypothetical protein